jgi:uncharacterized protein YbjT (DUF2867 family)
MMNVLVTGGTGTVGSRVVRALSPKTGVRIHVLSRDLAKLKSLPSGVTGVHGDLANPETIDRVFEDMDAVFLVNPVSPTEAFEGLLAVNGMMLASVDRVVYLSVHHTDAAAWLPHFGAKVAVETGIRRSGIPFTILRANNFFQNDYWYKDALLHDGVYPQPLGDAGVSRVDVRDIADAAAIALTMGDHQGQTYDLAGPHPMTGTRTAEIWSRALGTPITYGGDNLDAWQTAARTQMPDWMAFDFRYMYAYFQQCGFRASKEALDRLTAMLGHPPRSFEAFATETATSWHRQYA